MWPPLTMREVPPTMTWGCAKHTRRMRRCPPQALRSIARASANAAASSPKVAAPMVWIAHFAILRTTIERAARQRRQKNRRRKNRQSALQHSRNNFTPSPHPVSPQHIPGGSVWMMPQKQPSPKASKLIVHDLQFVPSVVLPGHSNTTPMVQMWHGC